MVHMRQPFYSIVSAVVYLAGALLLAAVSQSGAVVSVGFTTLNGSALLSVAGLFFIMAYFSLVHLKYR